MLTYQVRPRGLYTEPLGHEFVFPCDFQVKFTLAPAMPFGGPVTAGRTGVVGTKARIMFDSNSGRSLVLSSMPLEPIKSALNLGGDNVRFEREVCHLSVRCDSRQDLQDVLESYHYLLPILLNVEFLDAPIVATVTGSAQGVPFSWGITTPDTASLDATTTALQEQRIDATIRRFPLLDARAHSGRRRIVAALHWLHVACRLERVGSAPWEFLSEILLNYAKVLEVLFPASGGRTLESARAGLAQLGFSAEAIETWYVPALALRNNIDVAHVSLAVFKQADLEVLHRYAGSAEPHFRRLLASVLDEVAAGRWEPAEYASEGASRSAIAIVQKLREAQNAAAKAG